MRGHIRIRTGPRGTTYQLVVFVGVDEQGKRRYLRETVTGTKRDAEKRLAQLIAAVDAGQAGATSKMRLSDLVDAWWDACTGHLSPHTRIGYRGMLDRYVLPRFGSRRLDLKLQLPERVELVHSFETDDPMGIERYWHERFADRRANGEWFSLTKADVQAFKARRHFM